MRQSPQALRIDEYAWLSCSNLPFCFRRPLRPSAVGRYNAGWHGSKHGQTHRHDFFPSPRGYGTVFITFDGIDGVGKTTQIGRLVDWLESQGRRVVTCRDPGGTQLGERIRNLLLREDDVPLNMRAEMLLYMAARAQLVDEVIQPALAANAVVVSDRFLLSNVVYQGYGGGLDVASLWNIGREATAGLTPDLALVLDMDPQAAAGRRSGAGDRIERRDADYHARIRQGFLTEAEKNPQWIKVVDAAASVDAVGNDVRTQVASCLASHPSSAPA